MTNLADNNEGWVREMEEEEFDVFWNDELLPAYETNITNDWEEGDEKKITPDVYNAIEELIYPAMERRASPTGYGYDEDKVFETRSWGDYDHLEDLGKVDNYDRRLMALLNILYRWHFWCWGFEKCEEEGITFKSKQGQTLLQTYVFDAVDEVI